MLLQETNVHSISKHIFLYWQLNSKPLPEAVPSINYICRQLDVSYIGRQMYGEISIYQIRI